MRYLLLVLAGCAVVESWAIMPVWADVESRLDHDAARRLMQSGAILPLEQILSAHSKAQLGRILEVKLEMEAGRYVYEVDLVDADGQVWELEFNAANGDILERERKE